jgi:4-hydroxybutyryl-CoA dehydratase/vinylacetyl-CoA-Delta-isomerase
MNAPTPAATLMSGDDFRESLRRYKPRVFLDGRQVEAWSTSPASAPASMRSR